MSLFGKNIISAQVINARAEKLKKQALKDAKKKMRKGELVDSHSLALYLQTIDQRYAFVKDDIANATRVVNYAKIRADKVAETRQLLDFFSHDHAELVRLYHIVAQKAKQADRTEDLKQEKLSSVDVSKLKDSFNNLVDDDKKEEK